MERLIQLGNCQMLASSDRMQFAYGYAANFHLLTSTLDGFAGLFVPAPGSPAEVQPGVGRSQSGVL